MCYVFGNVCKEEIYGNTVSNRLSNMTEVKQMLEDDDLPEKQRIDSFLNRLYSTINS